MRGRGSFEVRRWRQLAGALTTAMASALYAGCGCSPSGPTGPSVSFTGTLQASAVVFHDFPPPPTTTQMDVEVRWTPAPIALRFIHGDPACDPIEMACPAFTDPIGPFPNTTGEIRSIITNQGRMAGPRMRLVLRNLDASLAATYTITITPKRAGCT